MTEGLGSLYRVWLALGRIVATVQTRLLLFLVFWLLITPLGLLRRLLVKATLAPSARTAPDGTKTYWLPPSPSESGSQHMDHMY